MHLKLGQVDHIIISSAEAAKAIMTTHDLTFASRPKLLAVQAMCYGGIDIAFSPYGSYWRQLRKICMLELLSAKRVTSFRACREEETSNLVQNIFTMSESPINLSQMFLLTANTVISRVAFGKKCAHGQKFISAAKRGIELASGFDVADLYPTVSIVDALCGVSSKVKKVHREVDEILEEIVKEHQERRATINSSKEDQQAEEEDLVDVLLGLKEKGELEFPLTIANIKAVILDMFIGGTETSSTTLEWVMSELIRKPETMRKAQEEVRQALKGKTQIEESDVAGLPYMKSVIREALRMHPVIPLLLPRLCSKACQVEGYDIPVGCRLLINAWAIARDPKYWDDADSFKPERFDEMMLEKKRSNFEYMPFGGGRRMCPGSTFAMAQMELALANILFHFDWKLPNGMRPKDLDMTETMGATCGRKSNLYLVATPYAPI